MDNSTTITCFCTILMPCPLYRVIDRVEPGRAGSSSCCSSGAVNVIVFDAVHGTHLLIERILLRLQDQKRIQASAQSPASRPKPLCSVQEHCIYRSEKSCLNAGEHQSLTSWVLSENACTLLLANTALSGCDCTVDMLSCSG